MQGIIEFLIITGPALILDLVKLTVIFVVVRYVLLKGGDRVIGVNFKSVMKGWQDNDKDTAISMYFSARLLAAAYVVGKYIS